MPARGRLPVPGAVHASSVIDAFAGYDHATEFEFGLDLILAALERYRAGA